MPATTTTMTQEEYSIIAIQRALAAVRDQRRDVSNGLNWIMNPELIDHAHKTMARLDRVETLLLAAETAMYADPAT
jgi:hypothetical protein